MRIAVLFSLIGFFQGFQGAVVEAGDKIRDMSYAIENSYRPYLQARATWTVGKSHKTSIVRDNDKGKYVDDFRLEDTRSGQPNSEPKRIQGEVIAARRTTYVFVIRGPGTELFVRSRVKIDETQFLTEIGGTSPSPSFGILLGEWIPDLLKELRSVSLSEVVIDGQPMQVLEGIAPDGGRLTLWFDTDKKVVRKINRIESFPRTDLSWKGVSDAAKASIPEQVVHCTFSMEDFRLVESVLVPHRIVEEVSYPPYPNTLPILDENGKSVLDIGKDGKVRILPGTHQKIVSTLEEIRFGKPGGDDLAITIPIPNGTPVVMEDAKHLGYVWCDGRAIPATDEAAKALARNKFFASRGASHLWFYVLGAVMLCVVLYAAIRRRTAKKGFGLR